MSPDRIVSSCARWLAACLTGVVIGVGGTVLGVAPAWASGHSPAHRAHEVSAQVNAAHRHRHHRGPGLPVVGNAKELGREPVVHATKGKAPSKLEVKDLVVGTGARATLSSTVRVMYVGVDYRNGKDFTQVTWTQKQPTTFPLDEVVPGFAKGIVGMRVGGRREIVIPPKLGYGPKGTGPIKPDETLVFVVDLKGVSG